MKKNILKNVLVGVAVVGAVIGLNIGVASAHVVVKPAQAGVGTYQTFTTSVPNEKDVLVTKIRVVIPANVKSVTPTVKPGWTIDTVKDGSGEDAVVKEITWSGGSIPAGQRDDFTFSAQVPAKPTTIQWKAYQTYEDGTTVSWDQKPAGSDDSEGNMGPYSETKIVDDLSTPAAATATSKPADETRSNVAIVLSVVALLLAFYAYTAKASKTKADKKAKD